MIRAGLVVIILSSHGSHDASHSTGYVCCGLLKINRRYNHLLRGCLLLNRAGREVCRCLLVPIICCNPLHHGAQKMIILDICCMWGSCRGPRHSVWYLGAIVIVIHRCL